MLTFTIVDGESVKYNWENPNKVMNIVIFFDSLLYTIKVINCDLQ